MSLGLWEFFWPPNWADPTPDQTIKIPRKPLIFRRNELAYPDLSPQGSTLPLYASDQASPFSNLDWPNPRSTSFPTELRTWIKLPQVETPVKPYDWSNPRLPQFYDRTWVRSQELETPVASPVPTYDWPNPRSTFYDRTWISTRQLVDESVPPNQYNWPVTLSKPFYDKTWVKSQQLETVVVTQPYNKYEWNNPRTKAFYNLSWINPLTPDEFTPCQVDSWEIFNARRHPDQTWINGFNVLLQQAPVKPPLGYDYPNPNGWLPRSSFYYTLLPLITPPPVVVSAEIHNRYFIADVGAMMCR